MNIAIWILQVLLAAAFLAHGWMFLFPSPEIAALMNASLPRPFTLFLGIAEIMAAFGLVVPGATRILPSLVAWAATGVTIVVGSATIYHLMRGEVSSAATTFVLALLAGFVAYMRFAVMPIRPRRTVA
jgi:uncharacterized membrane protein YphA (DoxX/SURF4 family)